MYDPPDSLACLVSAFCLTMLLAIVGFAAWCDYRWDANRDHPVAYARHIAELPLCGPKFDITKECRFH